MFDKNEQSQVLIEHVDKEGFIIYVPYEERYVSIHLAYDQARIFAELILRFQPERN